MIGTTLRFANRLTIIIECEMGGNVAQMGNKKNTQKLLIEKPEGKRHLEDLEADGTTLKYGV